MSLPKIIKEKVNIRKIANPDKLIKALCVSYPNSTV